MASARSSLRKRGPPRPLALDGGVIPSMWKVHGVLILCQTIFGGSAVIAKLGTANFNPAVFSLIRGFVSGQLLLLLAFYKEKSNFFIKWKCIPWFLISGFCLFVGQIGFIIGVKLSSAVMGSIWQPSQPIFTVIIAISLGWESPTWLKISGIVVAFLGAVFMVLTSERSFGEIILEPGNQEIAGNALFFFNCLCTALYVCFSRLLLQDYPSITVAGWSQFFASVWMCIATVLINTVGGGLGFVCPPEKGSDEPSCAAWEVLYDTTILSLVYFILLNSVAEFLMSWANQYAVPSNVLGYTAVQPLTSSFLTVIIKSCGYNGDLSSLGYNLFGGIMIVLGLCLLIADTRKHRKKISDYEEHSSKWLLEQQDTAGEN